MSGFKMDDYVDVAERIREFSEKYPDGSLQSELVYLTEPTGWLCTALAYRNPEDPRPGIGHAFEPVPGKTPYTKDSEAQNAETSAWGRAIVALGFKTKKIASAQEVRARQDGGGSTGAQRRAPAQSKPAAAAASAPSAADFETLSKELLVLAEQLGAREATAESLAKHEGDVAWVQRCIVSAKTNLAQKAKAEEKAA